VGGEYNPPLRNVLFKDTGCILNFMQLREDHSFPGPFGPCHQLSGNRVYIPGGQRKDRTILVKKKRKTWKCHKAYINL